MLGERTGYDSQSLDDLAKVYENWDGSGFPSGVAGADIPVPVQVVQVAALAVNAERLMGADAALALVGSARGTCCRPTWRQRCRPTPNRSWPRCTSRARSGTP